ncbi:MAG: phosphodiester glycosidase family protein [Pyrinomonadaceae bacterium]
MKKLFVFICVHLLTILLFVSVSTAQDFQTLRDGIEYARVTRQSKSADGKDENVVINLLRLDLTKVRLDVVHAMDSAIGLEKTSSIATRHGAFAAINAGFFRIDKSIFEGDDVGLLQINGKLLSESNGRTSLLIKNEKQETKISFDRLNLSVELCSKSQEIKSKISGINRERKNEDLILYTPEFHSTTLTDNNGVEIIEENGVIKQILEGQGSSQIPGGGSVISATGNYKEKLKSLKIGDKLSTCLQLTEGSNPTDNFKIIRTEDIVTGSPQLIKNGKIDITWQEEKTSKSFVETHHPRTAVAKLKDGKFLMVTVDGRSEESGGMSLYQLADFLLEQGATDAMNLDGGGSSTMFLDGKVVNHPSDKEGERKIGDAILVFQRK